MQNPNEEKPLHTPLAPRASVDIQTKPVINMNVAEEPTENLEGTYAKMKVEKLFTVCPNTLIREHPMVYGPYLQLVGDFCSKNY